MPIDEASPLVWVLTDGRPGHVSQTLGLAEAISSNPIVKTVQLRQPYRRFSPFLGWAGGKALTAGSSPLAPPWPDLIVTSGRSSIPAAFAVRMANQGRTVVVNVQDPGYWRSRFDLIAAPAHDRLDGPNIMPTLGALGRITPKRLADAAARFAGLFEPLPHPRVAVLIGGANAVYRTSSTTIRRVAGQLAAAADAGAGLMVTFSRRTGPDFESAIRAALAGRSAYIWDGAGENPYFAMLAFADHVVVTEDSASMVSEAATTGKPVSVVALEGGSAKFARFHAQMADRGITRPFTGVLDAWRYPPVDETARVADRVRALLSARHGPALSNVVKKGIS